MTAPALLGRSAVLQAAAQLCVDQGMTDFIVAPGSRSAPLTAALAQQPGLRCRVVYDERAAGYIALGMAQQSGRPVGLVCTSGTAAVNLAPAIVEAFYQGVSLLILTADRPAEWIDQQDNQAIRQRGLYEPHVRASYELPVDLSHPDTVWHALRILNEAIERARSPLPGPVHVNVPLREPLYPALARSEIGKSRAEGGSRIEVLPSQPQLTAQAWDGLLATWQVATRKLIVAGMHPSDEALRQALHSLSQQPDVAVIADITANLFPDGTPLHHGDAILGMGHEETLRGFQPDLVISFGGPVTSRYVKQFLRSYPPQAHWRVQPAGDAPDTYQTLTHVLPMQPGDFFGELARRACDLPASPGYAAVWQRWEAAAAQAVEGFLDTAGFGEFHATRRIMQALPAGSRLQVGNSMPVRYANLIGHTPGRALRSINSNRGTSGIDGAVSTAVGAALAGSDLTTLIVGDLGFFYDRNGLWHGHVPSNLRIVLLNNHGGGIFDIIDGPDRLPADVQREFFLTPQPLTAERTCADHELDYIHTADAASLEHALRTFFTPSSRAALLEIETDMATNSQVFRQFKSMLAMLPEADHGSAQSVLPSLPPVP
ncbi:MAG TPA: 2-succinyl-5-enolpyruvyl-6-hydroxy-3-cyclohexene-1-carboxylic-acid synthase [Anaerolineae bacterium]|nr:2-succinyl-5-enolpyruvyl-6-hydroxy-3-cyclohexene-1-carboxylic-acid synthase [Anaerolineae bacterium]